VRTAGPEWDTAVPSRFPEASEEHDKEERRSKVETHLFEAKAESEADTRPILMTREE
jgi:hypothetical protein